MDHQQRARRLLQYRERASAGKWISTQTKARLIALAVALAAIIYGGWMESAEWAIRVASFFAGWVFMLFWAVMATRREQRHGWPFTESVVDWDKVRQLADGASLNPPTPNPDQPSGSN